MLPKRGPARFVPAWDAVLEARLEALRQLLEAERRRADELRADRDAWRDQTQRLALPKPAETATQTVPAVRGGPSRRSWWPWRRSA